MFGGWQDFVRGRTNRVGVGCKGVGGWISLKEKSKQRLGSVKIPTLFDGFQVNMYDQCLGSLRPAQGDKLVSFRGRQE